MKPRVLCRGKTEPKSSDPEIGICYMVWIWLKCLSLPPNKGSCGEVLVPRVVVLRGRGTFNCWSFMVIFRSIVRGCFLRREGTGPWTLVSIWSPVSKCEFFLPCILLFLPPSMRLTRACATLFKLSASKLWSKETSFLHKVSLPQAFHCTNTKWTNTLHFLPYQSLDYERGKEEMNAYIVTCFFLLQYKWSWLKLPTILVYHLPALCLEVRLSLTESRLSCGRLCPQLCAIGRWWQL
jgi:hypothetical protein